MKEHPQSRPRDTLRFRQILSLLDTGTWVSGEDMSQRLGISRAAVAKHVLGLRRVGHAIEAAPRRGYRLRARAAPVTPESLDAVLETRVLGRGRRLFLEETGSTNNQAALLAFEGAPEGSLVVAEQQRSGKSRKSEDWFSSVRGLQFSVLTRPGAAQADSDLLMVCATLATAEAVRAASGLDARVKRPNDVLVDGRKVAGILVEMVLRGGEPDWAVTGVGCNVNLLEEEFPEALRPRVTSLLVASGRETDRARLLAGVLERLEYRHGQIARGEEAAVRRAWSALEVDREPGEDTAG